MADDFPSDRRQSNFYEFNDSNGGTSSRNQNPLISKVASALSTSYADSEIKDAIGVLDERGLQNTHLTRRQLRHDIQKEVIDSNGQMIQKLGSVAEQLKKINVTIIGLNHDFLEVKNHVNIALSDTTPILEETSILMAQKDQVEVREQLLKAFIDHFIISDDELAILISNHIPVNNEFFATFYKTKKIQKDCEILLGFENQRLGHEIIEQVSLNLDSAFQKLFRWIQREFQYLNLENPRITYSIRRALRVLAEQPSLFQNSLEFFAETRESTLSESFYSALSGTSMAGEQSVTLVKPIELDAHDPLRYIGDMLAWTHSATVSEREALEVIFISDQAEIVKGIEAGRKNEPWNQLFEDEGENFNFDGIKALNKLVDRDFNEVTRILRQRIGQLIQSHEETITAYKIVNLLNFYRVTFSKLLDDSSVLVNSLSSLEDSALRHFRMIMRDQVANLQADMQGAPQNLGPPEFLYEGFKQLTAIIETFETSFAASNSIEIDFQLILDDAFNPFMRRCEEIAKDLIAPNNSIFYLNCLLTAKRTLAKFNFVTQRLNIQKDIDKCTASLSIQQYSFLCDKSSLRPLLDATVSLSYSKEDLKAMRCLEALQPNTLIKTSETLDQFLTSALIDAIQNLNYLQDSILAREITEEAVERFCVDFEEVEKKLTASDKIWEQEENQLDKLPLRTYFPRTSSELRILLS